MKKILFIFTIFILISGVFLVNTSLVFGVEKSKFQEGLKKTGGGIDGNSGAGYNIKGGEDQINTEISNWIQSFLTLLGVIFLILMIYGGFLWMTAKGNAEQVTKSKNLITAAIIGLIIVVSAYAISYFVVSSLGEGALL